MFVHLYSFQKIHLIVKQQITSTFNSIWENILRWVLDIILVKMFFITYIYKYYIIKIR